MSTHEIAVHIGDAWEKAKDAASVAAAVVAAVLLVPGVGYGAAQVAGVAAVDLSPARVTAVQWIAGLLSAAVMAGVIWGIHRFTKRTPVVKR